MFEAEGTSPDLLPKSDFRFCNRLKRGGDCRWKILPECSMVPQLGSGNRVGERYGLFRRMVLLLPS